MSLIQSNLEALYMDYLSKPLPEGHVKKMLTILKNPANSDKQAWNECYGIWHNSKDWGYETGQFDIPHVGELATLEYPYRGSFSLYVRSNNSSDGMSRQEFEKVLLEYQKTFKASKSKVTKPTKASSGQGDNGQSELEMAQAEIKRLEALLKKNKIKF